MLETIIVILGFLLDRLSKIWALKELRVEGPIIILKDFFKLDYLENRGAAFGILQNKTWFLVLITVLIIGAMCYYLIKYKPKSKLIRVSLAMIMAGALGNFYDRIIYKFVVDFISVHYKNIYYFPTFNLADIFVTLGTIGLIIYLIKDEA